MTQILGLVYSTKGRHVGEHMIYAGYVTGIRGIL